MKTNILALAIGLACALTTALAEDITTLDGLVYTDVRDVAVKRNGLFFVTGPADAMHGVTVPFTNLTDNVKQKYHYDPFELGMAFARQNAVVYLNRHPAFSLKDLAAAKQKAQKEKKLLGFIMEWDSMLVPARPMGVGGSDSGLAHFYDVFNDGMVLVFVRHEDELGQVPDAVKQGFSGPEEGGFAPSMAVVTADCSWFVCEIPFGGKYSSGPIREKIFREKIAVIKKFTQSAGSSN